jgi:hypothetical protein
MFKDDGQKKTGYFLSPSEALKHAQENGYETCRCQFSDIIYMICGTQTPDDDREIIQVWPDQSETIYDY